MDCVVPSSGILSGPVFLTLGTLLATAWTYFVVRPRKLGLARVVLSLPPIVALTGIVTVCIGPEYSLTITVLTGIECLIAWKLAAYSLGRGPIMAGNLDGIVRFSGLMWLPVIPSAMFRTSRGSTVSRNAKTAVQFFQAMLFKALLAILFGMLSQASHLPLLMRDYFLALWLSQAIGAIWDASSVVAAGVFRLEVAGTSFDQPWLSSSFNEYW
jgi:hypothetical protein